MNSGSKNNEQPTTPLFLCGSDGCEVVYTSDEKQRVIEDARHTFARAYRKQHGEFPPMDLQIDVVMEASEALDRRASMRLVECPECEGQKEKIGPHGYERCEFCGGAGAVEETDVE